jgi:hypothetical protein
MTEFLLASYATFQATITESDSRGGFKGTELVPFDAESVVSKLNV